MLNDIVNIIFIFSYDDFFCLEVVVKKKTSIREFKQIATATSTTAAGSKKAPK